MKTMSKLGLIILALLLTAGIVAASLAEEPSEPAATASETETTAANEQDSANALAEALSAFSNARSDSRKQAWLDSLKQELDEYVAAGKLSQEQADLILKYYTEQLTLQQNGFGMRRKDRGTHGGRNGQGMRQNNFGKGGRNDRFGQALPGSGNTAPNPGVQQEAPSEGAGF